MPLPEAGCSFLDGFVKADGRTVARGAQLGQPYGTAPEPKESAGLRPGLTESAFQAEMPVDSQASRRFPGLRPGLTESAFQAEMPVRSPFPVSFFDPERVVLPAQGATLGLLGRNIRPLPLALIHGCSPFPVSFFDPERVVLPAQGATLGLLGRNPRPFSVPGFVFRP